jgi:hypothetical protein
MKHLLEEIKMTRINLVKYGFVRWSEEDFSDDGNRFTCYRAGKAVRVSKLVSDGQAYLSISSGVGNGTLPYEVYHKLPHWNDANWKWNGVSVDSLTEQDLIDFYNACIAYEQEYETAEAAIKYPTLEEIQEKAAKVTAKSLAELTTVETLLKKYSLEAIVKFSSYEWETVQEYTKRLLVDVQRYAPEAFPQTIVGTSYSFDFVKPNTHMEESFWFRHLKELFEKYCMKV